MDDDATEPDRSRPVASRRPSHFRFLDLPRELRDEIYGHLTPKVLVVDRTRKFRPKSPPGTIIALLRTNRQVNDEVKDKLYRSARAPRLNIVLKAFHKEDADAGHGPFKSLLPYTPIFQARKIHITILVNYTWNRNPFSEERRDHRWGCINPGQHETEFTTACVPADLTHIADILRERNHLPKVSVSFRSGSMAVPLTDSTRLLQLLPRLFRPLSHLCRIPGGIILKRIKWAQLASDQNARQFRHFFRALRRQTSREGPHAPPTDNEAKLLRAHFAYGEARTLYEPFKPWVSAGIRRKSAEELRAERRVQRKRLCRERLAAESLLIEWK